MFIILEVERKYDFQVQLVLELYEKGDNIYIIYFVVSLKLQEFFGWGVFEGIFLGNSTYVIFFM